MDIQYHNLIEMTLQMNAGNVRFYKKFYQETMYYKTDSEAVENYSKNEDEELRKEPVDNIQALDKTLKEIAELKRTYRRKVAGGESGDQAATVGKLEKSRKAKH